MLEWFETWIKGVNTGMQKTNSTMHLYEEATSRWVNGARYPTIPTYTTRYLNGADSLTSYAPARGGSDSLVWAQPTEVGARLGVSRATRVMAT